MRRAGPDVNPQISPSLDERPEDSSLPDFWRQALFEARFKGINPFCITIDDDAQAYLPRMFGAANFTVIEDVGKLPYKVSDIYRRIGA